MPTTIARKSKALLARALGKAKAVRDETTKFEEMTVSVSKLRESMSEYINAVHYLHQRLLLMKNGKPAVAMVPPEDLELLRQIEDAIDLDAAREALKEPGEVSWKDVKAKLGL